MVSYYPTAYRQQGIPAQSAQMHHTAPMHSWYAGNYHHPQAPQVMPPPSYCVQDEQSPQVWSHSAPHVFHQEFVDFNSLQLQHVPPQFHQQHAQQHTQHPHPNHNVHPQQQHNMSSPPITVSGSDTSSPGISGTISPQIASQNRPVTVRSPFEWIKKTGYQSQPNPGKTRTKDKYRVVYTDHQRVELEKEFYYSRYITIRRKAELANTLGLSERQVKIWFQNRRAKERKQGKKRDEFTHKDIIHLQQSSQQHQQQGIIDQQMPPQLM